MSEKQQKNSVEVSDKLELSMRARKIQHANVLIASGNVLNAEHVTSVS